MVLIHRKNKTSFCILLFFVMTLFKAYGVPGPTNTLPSLTTYKPIDWAKPLSGGPLKILFIVPRSTIDDIAGINDRLQMQYEVINFWSPSRIGYDPEACVGLDDTHSEQEILARIKRALQKKWEVIVLANVDTAIFPEHVLSDLLEVSAKGSGLVLAHLHDRADSPFVSTIEALEPESVPTPFWTGVAECAFPNAKPLDTIAHVFRNQKGRIITLDYPGTPPRHHCVIQTPENPWDLDELYLENAYSFVIRAFCVAAGRTNRPRITDVKDSAPRGPDQMEIPPDFYPEFVQSMYDSLVEQVSRPFMIVLDQPADRNYTLRMQIRRVASTTRITYQDKTAIQRGTQWSRFEIPIGPGDYVLDSWILDQAGIVDWFSIDVSIPGWPEFNNLTLKKTWILPSDSLDLTAEVRPVSVTNRNGCIYARMSDGYGRIVSTAQKGFGSEGGTISLRLHVSDLVSPIVKLEVFALEGEPRSFSEWELHSAFRQIRYVSVRQKQALPNIEIVVAVQHMQEYASSTLLSSLSTMGVSTIHAPAGEISIVTTAKSGLTLIPELISVSVDKALNSKYRAPCFNDPIYRRALETEIQEKTLQHWAGSCLRYSLGNGNKIVATEENVCQCGHCMLAFQEQLRERYVSVDTLNTAWKTTFNSFDSVELPDRAQNEGSPFITPTIDFRMFMDDQFASFHHWLRTQVKKYDSQAQVGARFAFDASLYSGHCWALLAQSLDFIIVDYSPLHIDKLHSYGKPNSWSGIALPLTEMWDQKKIEWVAWNIAFNQLPVLWIDAEKARGGLAACSLWFSPEGLPTDQFHTLAQAANQIRNTVGPLLFTSKKIEPTIAIYDSRASRYFTTISQPYSETIDDSQYAAAQLLRMNGYDFIFINNTAVDTLASFSVLVLPFCFCLDVEEEKNILSFVENGGFLISDVMPGTLDCHRVNRDTTVLAHMFGVSLGQDRDMGSYELVIDVEDYPKEAGWVTVDKSIRLSGGVALGHAEKTPAWIINRFGKGNTLLLNHPFRRIRQTEKKRIVPAEYKALELFLGNIKNESPCALETPKDFWGRVWHYTYADSCVYAILADPDAPKQRIYLPFDKQDYVYNVLLGERIKSPHKYGFPLDPGKSLVLTKLNDELKEIRMDIPDVAYPGQRIPVKLYAKNKGEKNGKRVFLVTVSPFSKSPIPWLTQTVESNNGYAEVFIFMPYNQPLGRYVITVKDVLTGVTVSTSLKVSLPEGISISK